MIVPKVNKQGKYFATVTATNGLTIWMTSKAYDTRLEMAFAVGELIGAINETECPFLLKRSKDGQYYGLLETGTHLWKTSEMYTQKAGVERALEILTELFPSIKKS